MILKMNLYLNNIVLACKALNDPDILFVDNSVSTYVIVRFGYDKPSTFYWNDADASNILHVDQLWQRIQPIVKLKIKEEYLEERALKRMEQLGFDEID